MSDLRAEAAFLYDEALGRRDSGNPSGALMRYMRCLEIAAELGDALWQAHLELEVAQMHHALYELAEAQRWYQRARAAFSALGDPSAEAAALVGLARACHLAGDYGQAVALLPDALNHARAGGDAVTEGQALTTLGQCHWDQGRPEEGLSWMVEGVARLAAAGAPEVAQAAEQLRYYGSRLSPDEFRAAVEAAISAPEVRHLVLGA